MFAVRGLAWRHGTGRGNGHGSSKGFPERRASAREAVGKATYGARRPAGPKVRCTFPDAACDPAPTTPTPRPRLGPTLEDHPAPLAPPYPSPDGVRRSELDTDLLP